MTHTNLADRMRLGEDSNLELKRVVLSDDRISNPHRNELSDELAAFANSRGGTLVLGVDDTTRDVVGIPLEHLDAVERWVCEICNDTVTPPLDLATRKIELPNASGTLVPVVKIDVDRSLFVHRSAGGYVRRIGGSKRGMSTEALARLFQDRSQTRMIRFDESLVPRTDPGDLDYSLTRRFLRKDSAEEDVNETLARKLCLVADDDDEVPRLLRSPPCCYVRANRSNGFRTRTYKPSVTRVSVRMSTIRLTPAPSEVHSTRRLRMR